MVLFNGDGKAGEWITPNSVTRAWGVETEERDGLRTVKTWAEWSVVRPNPNQESRRGAAEGRIDWRKQTVGGAGETSAQY